MTLDAFLILLAGVSAPLLPAYLCGDGRIAVQAASAILAVAVLVGLLLR